MATKRIITYFVPQKLMLTAKQVAKLEAAHREHWGDPDYQLTNFDLVEAAMRAGMIEQEDGWGVETEDGQVSF